MNFHSVAFERFGIVGLVGKFCFCRLGLVCLVLYVLLGLVW